MAKFRLERVLPYDADKLWQMVGDVELYPEFIPWITRLQTYNRTGERFDADVNVGFRMLSERFSTRVTRDADTRTVDFALIRGPFRRLNGRWSFAEVEGGAKIVFDMDVEIRNPILDALFRANFDRAVSKLLAAFEQRAATLYKPQ